MSKDIDIRSAIAETAHEDICVQESQESIAEELKERITELEEAIKDFQKKKTTGAMSKMFDLI